MSYYANCPTCYGVPRGECPDCGTRNERTVLDVARASQNTLASQLRAVGIDPDMPFERFQRWLRYGQRVDEMTTSGMPDEAVMPVVRGWDACLNHIKEQS